MSSSSVETLTDREYWEGYWEKGIHEVPEEIALIDNKYADALYYPFRKFIDSSKPISALEIGGAPGLFVSGLTKMHPNLKPGVLDYTDRGVNETKAVSEKFGINIAIHKKDMFVDDLSDLPPYDVVYSLGVVEHYEDLELSFDKHLECAGPGGIVIFGLPVFLGINDWLAGRLAPDNRDTWYTAIMEKESWKKFYERKDIEVLFDDYVGGFNPHVHHRFVTEKTVFNRAIYVGLHALFAKVWDKIPGTDRLNSKRFSFYYYFVVRKLPAIETAS
ncbi:MAG: hypothetical protein R2684_15685 [Pyrinomonadaceae bacterium]